MLSVNELKSESIKFTERLRVANERCTSIDKEFECSEKRLDSLEKLKDLVQEVSKRTQDKLRLRFEAVVQACLDAVFPNEYKFVMEFVCRRNQTETDFFLVKNGKRIDPMTASGGGVVDVISISLRICCLTLSRNKRVLFLDEPFSHLRGDNSDDNPRTRIGKLLSILSERMHVQIIAVADVGGGSMEGKKFMVTKNDTISKVTES